MSINLSDLLTVERAAVSTVMVVFVTLPNFHNGWSVEIDGMENS